MQSRVDVCSMFIVNQRSVRRSDQRRLQNKIQRFHQVDILNYFRINDFCNSTAGIHIGRKDVAATYVMLNHFTCH